MEKKYDVLIVGTGLGGLYTALSLPENLSVLMLSKKEDTLCNSSLAQGGVAAVLSFENDSFDLHFADTMVAGQQANDPDAVNVLVHEGPDDVRKIMGYGVEFDKNPDGSIQKTLEGGHCRRRIVHHKDTTGAEIVNKLLVEIHKRKNITQVQNAMVYALQKVKSGFCADILKDGAARLQDGTISGSSATLLDCVKTAVKFGIPFDDAVKMASETPANMLGTKKGRIEKGCDADLLIVDDEININTVIIGGKVLA